VSASSPESPPESNCGYAVAMKKFREIIEIEASQRQRFAERLSTQEL
jgi:hypothetical protein